MSKLYSEAVKGASCNEDSLLKKLHDMKKDVPKGNPNKLLEKLDESINILENIQRETKKDSDKKQEQITKLEKRVSILENEIRELKKSVKSMNTVDMGEALVTVLGTHVAALVLPRGESIAKVGAFTQMFEHVQEHKKNKTWKLLQKQCKMTWVAKHFDAQSELQKGRNVEAHHKKFHLTSLKKVLGEIMPHRKNECEDLMMLFEVVDSIMKFGMIANELICCPDISESEKDSLHKIANSCYRDVKYLQDIELVKAEKHLRKYMEARDYHTPSNIVEVINKKNKPRLGRLVKNKEEEIVCDVLGETATLTFEGMNNILARKEPKNREKTKKWSTLMDGKMWTEDHRRAIIVLKNLLPNDMCNERVEPLPIEIAKLHVADFLSEGLWDAGSDLLHIFERHTSVHAFPY